MRGGDGVLGPLEPARHRGRTPFDNAHRSCATNTCRCHHHRFQLGAGLDWPPPFNGLDIALLIARRAAISDPGHLRCFSTAIPASLHRISVDVQARGSCSRPRRTDSPTLAQNERASAHRRLTHFYRRSGPADTRPARTGNFIPRCHAAPGFMTRWRPLAGIALLAVAGVALTGLTLHLLEVTDMRAPCHRPGDRPARTAVRQLLGGIRSR